MNFLSRSLSGLHCSCVVQRWATLNCSKCYILEFWPDRTCGDRMCFMIVRIWLHYKKQQHVIQHTDLVSSWCIASLPHTHRENLFTLWSRVKVSVLYFSHLYFPFLLVCSLPLAQSAYLTSQKHHVVTRPHHQRPWHLKSLASWEVLLESVLGAVLGREDSGRSVSFTIGPLLLGLPAFWSVAYLQVEREASVPLWHLESDRDTDSAVCYGLSRDS